jgi:uncharacterized protein (TIGR00730 family)
MRSVCIFCGSNPGERPEYRAAAVELAERLARSGRRVVYGGARVGIMGAVADAALAAGGEVVGVIPEALVSREVAHRGLTELLVVDSMHTRKATMSALSDAFVVLPGGLGTLEELFEVWTWAQLGIHDKPIGLLDVAGYWQPLESFLDHAVAEGFVRAPHRDLVFLEDEPEALLTRLEQHRGREHVERVLDPDET